MRCPHCLSPLAVLPVDGEPHLIALIPDTRGTRAEAVIDAELVQRWGLTEQRAKDELSKVLKQAKETE